MKPKTVRALDRGLEILRCLQNEGSASLHELHLRLALPKPTLLRLLATLEHSGFVWQGLEGGRYHPSQVHHLRERRHQSDKLAEVSGPVLDWLVNKIQWPSDLSVRHGAHMQLRESSRLHSYFSLHRLSIGFRINMALSAPGRAYLAFCPERERRAIISQLRAAKDPGLIQVGGEEPLLRIVADARSRGFGTRDPRWGGHVSQPKSAYDDGLMAIAVPILVKGRAIGCINLVWIARLFKPGQIVKEHLADLQQAAALISTRYSAGPR